MLQQIYTSRYSNKGITNESHVPVGISAGFPRFSLGYKIATSIRNLAPSATLRKVEDRETFEAAYRKQLEAVGVKTIRQFFDSLTTEGKSIVLLCFEDVRKEENWCHRIIFARWWKEKTGETIEELPDVSEIRYTPAEKKAARQVIPCLLF